MKLIFALLSLFGLCYMINKYIVYYNYSSKESCRITYKPIITNEEYTKKMEKGYQELEGENNTWETRKDEYEKYIIDHPDDLARCVDKCREDMYQGRIKEIYPCFKKCRSDFG